MTPKRFKRLEEAISRASGVTIADMRGRSRQRPFAEARQAVWLIAHDHLGFSYFTIAKEYERDHTTIISGAGRMRGHKMMPGIIEGIRKTHPEMFLRPGPGEAKTVENWRI